MKECKYCQGFGLIIDVKGFYIELDNDNLLVSYNDNKTRTGNSWTKKINFCPMCGQSLKNAGDGHDQKSKT